LNLLFVYKIITVAAIFEIEFDPNKDRLNLAKHGISLGQAVDFEWDNAQVEEDLRFFYAERRFEATGWLEDRLHVLVYCMRGSVTRIINLRRANGREAKAYANHD
jgi:uncharacterized DUF497 family protein